MKTPDINKSNTQNGSTNPSEKTQTNKSIIEKTTSPDFSIPIDLIDDLKKGKIDPLTEGKTNLGYEERSPRKKELEEKEHYDKEDK